MLIKKTLSTLTLSLIFLLAVNTSHAESVMDLGEYEVHYNALPTTFLDSRIARSYNIKRSANRGLINIAILKKTKGTTGVPVTGMVNVYSTNMANQLKKISLRKVVEQDNSAIYYIGEFKVANEETLNFTISVSPENKKPPSEIKFSKQFFAN